jgi:hypothetical protein
MFGSNWFGATLRHDWMALLGLGACALKREKWMLGGALLAWSAMIRAFPALALAAVTVPGVFWVSEYRRTTKKFPTLRVLWEKQQSVLKTLLGAAVCVVVWFAVSTAVLGFSAWVQWLHKAYLLATGPHVNHVSLRALMAWDPRYTFEALQRMPPPDTADWGVWQERVFFARRGAFAVVVVVFVAMVASASSRRRLEQAAILGLTLIPIVFYPANYYAHFVYLLPLLAVEKSWKSEAPTTSAGGVVWIAVTAMCAVQYFTVLEKDLDMHFNYASLILVLTLAAVLASLLVEDYFLYSRVATAGAGPAKSKRPRRAATRPATPKATPAAAGGSADAAPPAESAVQAEPVSPVEPAAAADPESPAAAPEPSEPALPGDAARREPESS